MFVNFYDTCQNLPCLVTLLKASSGPVGGEKERSEKGEQKTTDGDRQKLRDCRTGTFLPCQTSHNGPCFDLYSFHFYVALQMFFTLIRCYLSSYDLWVEDTTCSPQSKLPEVL